MALLNLPTIHISGIGCIIPKDPRVLPFFSLARELRDLIYTHLLDPSEEDINNQTLFSGDCYEDDLPTAALKNGLAPGYEFVKYPHHFPSFATKRHGGYFRVSRQFAKEFEEILWKEAVLILKGVAETQIWQKLWLLGGGCSLRKVERVEIRIATSCGRCWGWPADEVNPCEGKCGGRRGLRDVRLWIEENLAQFPRLRELRVKIGLTWFCQERFVWPRLPYAQGSLRELKKYVKIPGLASLEVYHSFEGQYNDHESEHRFTEDRLYASWTGEGDWKVPEPRSDLRDDGLAQYD